MSIDRRERVFDFEETMRLLLRQLQSKIWTALPGQVVTFYPSEMTADIQPAINCLVTDSTGVRQPWQMPVLPHVPCQFPGGGGATLTWTPVPGDECLVVFAARCIDAWWVAGFQNPSTVNPSGNHSNPANTPPEVRMHDLSDGFAILGVRNKTRAYAPVSGGVQLQSDDGSSYIQLNPATGAMKVLAPGGVNINGATISANGEITDALGKVLGTHEHSGVTTGSGTSGPPV